MAAYDLPKAQKEYFDRMTEYIKSDERMQAILFAKILIKQTVYSETHIKFCNDNELFVSKTLTGYDVVGYYIGASGVKRSFNITVCKINDLWYPSERYVGADTKSYSGSILLWLLLLLGCTLLGILMYYLMSAAIGI